MTYQPTAQESALWAWLDAVVGSKVDDIRFANQAEPIAGDLTVTLQVTQTRRISTPEVKIVTNADGETVYSVHEHRTGTVSVNAFGPGHRGVIEAIERSMWYPPTLQKNTASGIEIQNPLSDAQDLTALVSTDYIGRTNQDFLFAFNTTWEGSDRASVILAAEASGDISGVGVDTNVEVPRIQVQIVAGHNVTVTTQVIASMGADIVAGQSVCVIAGIVSATGAEINAMHAVDGAASMVRSLDADISAGNSLSVRAGRVLGAGAVVSAGSSVGVVDRVTKTQRATASIMSGHSVTASGGIPNPLVERYQGILGLSPAVLFAMEGLELTEWNGTPIYYADAAGTTPIYAAGDPIGGMLDLVSGTIKATQTTDGSRPILGVDAVGFNGTTQYFAGDNPLSTDARTVIVAATSPTLHRGTLTGTRTDSVSGFQIRTEGNPTIRAFQSTGGRLDIPGHTAGTPFVVSAKFDTTDGHWGRIAGNSAVTDASVVETVASSKLCIGALEYGSGPSTADPFNGKITTDAAWTSALTTPEITTVEGLLS